MFNKGDRIHLIGIKGVGMTALAAVLKKRGCVVTGSDTEESFFTDAVLKKLKISVKTPFSAANILKNVDLVISSVAYFYEGKALGKNPEVIETVGRIAQGENVKIFTYPQALGEIAKDYRVIAVAGSHGKSTTTALLGVILEQAKLDPVVIAGTKIVSWGSNARAGKGSYLVVEADEYKDAFLNYKPYGAIVTSIDWDHPDYFKTEADYFHSFARLINNIPKGGFLVAHGGEPNVRKLISHAQDKGVDVTSYGFSKSNDFQASDLGIVKQKQLFHIMFHGKHFVQLGNKAKRWEGSIGFPGQQYILNSLAAFATAIRLGVKPEIALAAIKSFKGTARRLELLKRKPAIIFDDYAHHPTAIRVTLAGIRKMYPKEKIVAIFQPHMFSRTATFLEAFSRSFSDADEVGIMEIFPSARETGGPIGGRDLARETKKQHPSAHFLETFSEAVKFLKTHQKAGTVIVLMGAGDVYKLAEG